MLMILEFLLKLSIQINAILNFSIMNYWQS